MVIGASRGIGLSVSFAAACPGCVYAQVSAKTQIPSLRTGCKSFVITSLAWHAACRCLSRVLPVQLAEALKNKGYKVIAAVRRTTEELQVLGVEVCEGTDFHLKCNLVQPAATVVEATQSWRWVLQALMLAQALAILLWKAGS